MVETCWNPQPDNVLLVGMEGPVGIPTIIIPRNQPMGKGHLRSIEKETDVNCMHCILESSPVWRKKETHQIINFFDRSLNFLDINCPFPTISWLQDLIQAKWSSDMFSDSSERAVKSLSSVPSKFKAAKRLVFQRISVIIQQKDVGILKRLAAKLRFTHGFVLFA